MILRFMRSRPPCQALSGSVPHVRLSLGARSLLLILCLPLSLRLSSLYSVSVSLSLSLSKINKNIKKYVFKKRLGQAGFAKGPRAPWLQQSTDLSEHASEAPGQGGRVGRGEAVKTQSVFESSCSQPPGLPIHSAWSGIREFAFQVFRCC